MNLFSCSRSPELAAALKAGHLPSAWEPSLRDHVEICRHCSDLVLVTSTLHNARAESIQGTPLGSPSMLWWRAQLRRRNDALQRISRPTSIVGKLALLSTALVAIVLLFWQRHESAEWLRWLGGLPSSNGFHTLVAPNSLWGLLLVIFTFGAFVFLGGFVIYLASEKS